MNPLPFGDSYEQEPDPTQNDQKWSGPRIDPEKQISILICKALRAEREKQKISQQRLSEMADISRTGLRHIESLETAPTLFSILKVAKALNVKVSDLLQNLDR